MAVKSEHAVTTILGLMLSEQLGVDPEHVTRITIDLRVGYAATVEITCFLDNKSMETLGQELQTGRYKLVKVAE